MITIRPLPSLTDLNLVQDSGIPEVTVISAEWFQPGSLKLIAASETGTVCAAILLLPDQHPNETFLSYRLAWLGVAASFRRQGIARALLQSAATHAVQMGAQLIHAPISPANTDAISLFEHLGPTETPFLVRLVDGGL